MRQYLNEHPETFEPEEISALVEALDRAWAEVQSRDATISGQEARMALARLIVEHAKQGERHVQRLVDDALERFKV